MSGHRRRPCAIGASGLGCVSVIGASLSYKETRAPVRTKPRGPLANDACWFLCKSARCSRICNGQNTQEPQGSTGLGSQSVRYSIESTYFHLISTDFNKQRDLFWDRWSHLHNLHELSGLQRGLAGDSVGFVALQVSSLRLCAGIL
jgi:hypothetical protein